MQTSKEYNSKTGKWETFHFKEDKKGRVHASPAKKKTKSIDRKEYKGITKVLKKAMED